MNQITKFYLTSFLKNQTYFTPILVLFLQFYHLSFQEVFWVFTIGSIFSFIIEIPTGVLADFYGKKKSIIYSRFFVFISFLVFGFSTNFWMFVIAQLMYELGNAFRSGTETAFTFDYIKQNGGKVPSYTEVRGKQKFWARVGESIATALGGFIAVNFGFNWVFFVAAVPAFLNLVLAFAWEEIKEREGGVTLKGSISHVKKSSIYIFRNKSLLRLTLNIMLFSSVVAALGKFIQPYMVDANVPVAWFGIVYAVAFSITAIAVRYSYVFEEKFGKINTINSFSFLAVVPVVIIGFKFISVLGVVLFFLVVIIQNIRSPIANNAFHVMVESEKRATLGSILALFKSVGKILILPMAGYFADVFSLYTSILILGFVLLINAWLFYLVREKK